MQSYREFGIRLSDWMGRWMFLLVPASLFFGMVCHSSFYRAQGLVEWLFAYMTFVTALGTRWNEFLRSLRQPLPIAATLALVHVALPAIAFGLGAVALGNPDMVAGLVLAAAIPVGVTSVMWTAMSGGDVSLALAIVTLDTLLSPLVVPLTVFVALGQTVHVNLTALFFGLVKMVVAPSVLGIALNERTEGRLGDRVKATAGWTSKLGLLFVVVINAAMVEPTLRGGGITTRMIAVLVIISIAGYAVGFWAASWFPDTERMRASMVYNTGMRNLSAGIVIAMGYFSPKVAIPVVLAILFQQPFASVSHRILTWKRERDERLALMAPAAESPFQEESPAMPDRE